MDTMTILRKSRPVLASLAVLAGVLAPMAAHAEDVTVMISGGFKSTFDALVPAFEKQSGDHVTTLPGPSMGTTQNAIPVRLARGEPDDVLILVGYALDDLIKKGQGAAGSRVDLARASIGMAVKQGAPVPDISTPEKLKAVLLAAKSIAYSDSASGVYIQNEMFKKLGIEEQVKGKARMIPATPVAEIVAKGEAEVGFQQIAELKPIKGVTVVGPIPDAVQSVTVFSAGLSAKAQHPKAAHDLIAFMSGPEARPVLQQMGLEPVGP